MTTDDRPILSDTHTQPMDASTANNDDPEFDSMIAIDASMHEETPPPPQPKYFQGPLAIRIGLLIVMLAG